MKYFFICVFIALNIPIRAQIGVPLNDDCFHSYELKNVIDAHYRGIDYTNIGANEAIENNCLRSYEGKTVWYHLSSISKFTRIIIEGQFGANNLTLNNVALAVFSGNCNNLNEIICSSPTSTNIAEVIIPTTPGTKYYIAIAGRKLTEGSFDIYINSFNNDPEPLQDCNNARILCDKSILEVEKVVGHGGNKDNLNFETNPALNYNGCNVTEDASNWYKWTCDESGTLEFTITPLKPYDDIDFLVYELPNGLEDCNSKVLIRNMISGENNGQAFSEWKVCVGPTGLLATDKDLGEACGCQSGNNNFAAAINMVEGKSYALVIMNFSQSGVGYHLNFGGTGTFLGPKPNFTVDPLEGLRCDQSFVINDQTKDNGNPLTYEWFFGEGSVPNSATGEGPFSINYENWGKKYIVLTVADKVNGCEVTNVVELNAEPCCEDLPALFNEIVEVGETTCPWSKDGYFNLSTKEGGGPIYRYSIDGSPFVESSEFRNLEGGHYRVIVTDKKGCFDTITVEVPSPDSVYVDAGNDTEITLGETHVLKGKLDENGHLVNIKWEPRDKIEDCFDCLDPTVFPLNQTTFTIIATDENGCEYRDIVTIKINKNLPIYIPNAFTPNGDGINDKFNAFGNRAIKEIQKLTIFHRWGGIAHIGHHFPANNDRQFGWNGMINNQVAPPGVYTYLFEVKFIDDSVGIYSGDVTVIK